MNSKTQLKKKSEARTYERVKCEKCGSTNSTLYNFGGRYYCSKHVPDVFYTDKNTKTGVKQ